MSNRREFLTVRELIAQLQTCDPDADVWVTTQGNDDELDASKMGLVTSIEFLDNDDEMSREIGRRKMGVPYLREPVLRVEPNE